MAKDDVIEIEGIVTDALPNAMFNVDIGNGHTVLANGKDRALDRPKRKKRKHVQKVLRSETRVAEKLRLGDKVLNGELRRDLAFLAREMQANNLGG